MNPEQAIRDLSAAVARVCAAGYAVNGELVFCRPATPGLVEALATGHVGRPGVSPHRLVVTTRPAEGQAVPAKAPAPLPTLVAKASSPEPETHEAVRQAEVETGKRFVSKAAAGDVCIRCGGSNLRWAGACRVCNDCGEAGGCG